MITFNTLLTLTLLALASAEPNSITLYNQQNDRSHTCYGYEKDLSKMDFNDKVSSIKVNGIWILYENTNYNTQEQGMSFFTYGSFYLEKNLGEFKNKASSLRNSGVGSNYKDSSINFYEREGFGGKEEFYTNDVPYPEGSQFGKSIIITGCSEWTIYSEKYFAGESVCIRPSDMNKCLPKFYSTVDELGLGHRLRSARMGCHSILSVKGVELPVNTTGIFNPKPIGFRELFWHL